MSFLTGHISMIIYSISIIVKNSVVSEWLSWMNQEHIPEILATGLFLDYRIMKNLIPSSLSDETNFIINYRLKSIEDYHVYAEKYSPALQSKHHEKFPGKFRASRSVLELLRDDQSA